MLQTQDLMAQILEFWFWSVVFSLSPPFPDVAVPDLGKQAERSGVPPVVGHGVADQRCIGILLSVDNVEIEESGVVEKVGVGDLELVIVTSTVTVHLA